jgi:hypothetical protein
MDSVENSTSLHALTTAFSRQHVQQSGCGIIGLWKCGKIKDFTHITHNPSRGCEVGEGRNQQTPTSFLPPLALSPIHLSGLQKKIFYLFFNGGLFYARKGKARPPAVSFI